MKQIICTTLFFVLFLVLHTLVSWLFPFLFYVWYVVWPVIGLVSLLVCKFIYNWLERQEKRYLPPKRQATVFFSLVFVAISIFGFQYWNSYQEKSLKDVLDRYSYPKEISIDTYSYLKKISINTNMDSWKIRDSQTISELMEFLSQYKVKKTRKEREYQISESTYEIMWKNEKGLNGPAMVMIKIGENHIWIIGEDHYNVLNAPVDIGRIKSYSSRD
ncbi:hypothetical protein [Bacillus sp. 1P02SD]|uniref:hypothetical protein n=1 Tax=Bacillus sp. 1P02SD TaxID=3132264 RepID=UPI0039A2E0D6